MNTLYTLPYWGLMLLFLLGVYTGQLYYRALSKSRPIALFLLVLGSVLGQAVAIWLSV